MVYFFAKHFLQNTFSLDGEWRFVWNQFLEPDDPVWLSSDVIMASIPCVWSNINVDSAFLPNTGYASMQLEVQTPPDNQKVQSKSEPGWNSIYTVY